MQSQEARARTHRRCNCYLGLIYFGPMGQCSCLGRELESLKEFKKKVSELTASEAEKAKFAEAGPEGWLAEQGYDELIKTEVGSGLIKAFKFFHYIVTAKST